MFACPNWLQLYCKKNAVTWESSQQLDMFSQPIRSLHPKALSSIPSITQGATAQDLKVCK